MILSWSWISLICLSMNVVSLSCPSCCVLRSFLRLSDVTVVSRMMSWLYFLVSSLAFFLMVLHISTYSNHCLSSLLPTIFCRFIIRAYVCDDILDFSGSLIALATLDVLSWIMSMMVSLMMSL